MTAVYATSENATQAILTPIIGDISTSVTGAVSSLNLLVGQPTSVIMASVDGTTILAASDIAALLAVVVNVRLSLRTFDSSPNTAVPIAHLHGC